MTHPLLQKLLRHPLFLVSAFLSLEEMLYYLLLLTIPRITVGLGWHTPLFVRDLRSEFDLAVGVFAAAALVRIIGPWPRLTGSFGEMRKLWQGVAGIVGTLTAFFLIKAVVNQDGVHLFNPENHHFPLIFALMLSLCAAVIEETAYRGYVLPFLEKHYGTVAAVAGSALIFGGMHLFNGDQYTLYNCLLIATSGGLLFSAAYVLTRRLYLSIGLHWGYDMASFFLLGDTHFHPLYNSHSAQTILVFLCIAEMYTGLLFLYLAYKWGRLPLSARSEALLRFLRVMKPQSF